MLTELQKPNCVLDSLKLALSLVGQTYLSQTYRNLNGPRLQKPERVFVAELYHQLRKLQDSNNHECIKNHSFHIELTKTNFTIPNNSCNVPIPSKVSPDIVLHRSQDDSQRENQILVCEVKMEGSSTRSILKDIKKLIFYKISRLQFQHAAFIFTGSKSDLDRIFERFGRYDENLELLNCIKEKGILFFAKDQNQWGVYVLR